MRLLKKRNLELENWILTCFEWDFVSKKDLEILSSQFELNTYYSFPTAAKILNISTTSLFKRICSQIGISYYEVEKIFLEQNRDFFNSTKYFSRKILSENFGEFFVNLFNTIIVPKPTNVEKLLKQIRNLSPEEQAEVLQIIARKRIKIVAEDI